MTEGAIFVPQEASDEFPSEEESNRDVSWPNADLDKKRMNAVLKNPHFMRKKRIHSASFSHSNTSAPASAHDIHLLSSVLQRARVSGTRCLYGKNSRRSRDGRRVTKKRVGKNLDDPTDVLDEIVLDHDDPDYDSDSDPIVFEPLSPAPSDEDFERIFTDLVNEFFDHGRTDEVLATLKTLNLAPHQLRRLPYLAVAAALQHKSTECELTSELLSDMYGKILTQAHVQQGFAMILNELGELTIDTPKAPDFVGRFIARALLDDILPPKFIEFQKKALTQSPTVPSHPREDNTLGATASLPTSASLTTREAVPWLDGSVPTEGSAFARNNTRNLSDSSNVVSNNCASTEPASSTGVSSGIGSASSLVSSGVQSSQLAVSALVKAENWLTMSRMFRRLDNIWGVPAGPKGTEQLSKKMYELIQNFFESDDLNEVNEGLADLDSPHFLHDFVFQAIITAIEIGTDDARSRVVRLLAELCHSLVITKMQMELGVKRVYAELPDLQLDVPTAYVLMERFLRAAKQKGFVSEELSKQMPTKPRKRFVSEADSSNRRSRNPHPL